ncbi:hypothetical protein [Nitrospirillum sp. BR 11163]|uniref:hypothetical protein n=1 Tax=Nitrospirillum sp. BR 11163 TaxID=3104323 RepID=UPI002AFFEEF1|nr:hypothetical protein [Nitrospirillum sp. BR 11163]MEA1674070.1 hypothetical protein [Nitrospirillum sp. BR 11163]
MTITFIKTPSIGKTETGTRFVGRPLDEIEPYGPGDAEAAMVARIVGILRAHRASYATGHQLGLLQAARYHREFMQVIKSEMRAELALRKRIGKPLGEHMRLLMGEYRLHREAAQNFHTWAGGLTVGHQLRAAEIRALITVYDLDGGLAPDQDEGVRSE